ncbi:MAG TPA: EamA family transporter [Steroidobacteraceae bacterium]|nr:EamA family transporter [Steroidobacteraceae bacterium]
MSSASLWIVFALLSALFAGLTAVTVKAGLAGVDPDFALLLRVVLVTVLLLPLVVMTGKWTNPASLPPRSLGFLALSAVATAASWLCYFRALQLGTVAQVATLDKLSVAFAVVLALVFLGERPNAREWLGMLLVVAGAFVMAYRR